MVTASRARVAVLMAAIVLCTSCTRVIDDARVVASTDSPAAAPDSPSAAADVPDCAPFDGPQATIPDRGDDEPVLKVPTPEGWERVTMMDSELIRFAMRNATLERDGFAPTAVVTLESQPGITDPQVVFDAQRAALESGLGATDLRVTEGTLCGLAAETVDYTAPAMGLVGPHPVSAAFAVLNTDDATFAAAVTVQTTDPDNPTYRRDAQSILTGFQMLPPD